jgi:uncharacterized protein (DUF427 family)
MPRNWCKFCVSYKRTLTRKDKILTEFEIRWEHHRFPVYYFRLSDIRQEYLTNKIAGDNEVDIYDLVVDGKTSAAAVTVAKAADLNGYAKIDPTKVDAVFEEDERIFGHPRDPYKRIITLQSSKKVQIEIDGVEVASTTRPVLLYETGLPLRFYIPHTDVRLDLLEDDTETRSYCPYKVCSLSFSCPSLFILMTSSQGDASYYFVKLPNGEKKRGLAWWYKTPKTETSEIKGHVAFYDEKVDVRVNGVRNQRPVTQFS